MKPHYDRIGAAFFFLWGLLHVVGGGMLLLSELGGSTQEALRSLGSALAPGEIPAVTGGVVGGLVAFHAWNILWMGLLSAAIAVLFNWHNSRLGYWLNLVIAGSADLGLVFALLIPGVMAPADGSPGLILFGLAAVFSTLGLRSAPRMVVGVQHGVPA